MTIKEVEQELGIPRATIRFYEKEELINPKRGGNSYREYSDEDVAVLKKVIVLRKIGLSVSDIKAFLQGDVPLQQLLEENISQLQEKVKELSGAIKVCQIMQSRKEDIHSFDEQFYWEEITTEEKAGNKFLDIVNDVVQYEKKVVRRELGIGDNEGNPIYGKKESVLRAFGTCVLVGVVWYLLDGMKIDAFIEGFFWPFTCIIIYSIVGLPLHFLERKHPKAAAVIRKIGIGIGVAFIVVLLLVVIFGEQV